MDDILTLIQWLLIVIPVGVGITVVRCLISIAVSGDEAPSYKKRMVNAVIFLAPAESAMALVYVIAGYFNL